MNHVGLIGGPRHALERRGGGGGRLDPEGGSGGVDPPPCQQEKIFGAKDAGKCFCMISPYLVDPPPCQQRSQCKVNSKQ